MIIWQLRSAEVSLNVLRKQFKSQRILANGRRVNGTKTTIKRKELNFQLHVLTGPIGKVMWKSGGVDISVYIVADIRVRKEAGKE